MFLEILQNSQENTCTRVSFLIKLQTSGCNIMKKETLAQVFSCKFCKISTNTFFKEHLWVTASLFRHLQSYSGAFNNIQPCSGTLRDIKGALSWGTMTNKVLVKQNTPLNITNRLLSCNRNHSNAISKVLSIDNTFFVILNPAYHTIDKSRNKLHYIVRFVHELWVSTIMIHRILGGPTEGDLTRFQENWYKIKEF